MDGAPDQIQRVLGGAPASEEILYSTEEGGRDSGIHGRNPQGQFFTILESPLYQSETTGLAFSPSGKHMYVAYQENDKIFEITRKDGLPFGGRMLDVRYHNRPT